MAYQILSEITASIADLKKDPMGIVAAGKGFPVAILNRNVPVFYCVRADVYESMMSRLEDHELNVIAEARAGQHVTKVTLNEL